MFSFHSVNGSVYANIIPILHTNGAQWVTQASLLMQCETSRAETCATF